MGDKLEGCVIEEVSASAVNYVQAVHIREGHRRTEGQDSHAQGEDGSPPPETIAAGKPSLHAPFRPSSMPVCHKPSTRGDGLPASQLYLTAALRTNGGMGAIFTRGSGLK